MSTEYAERLLNQAQIVEEVEKALCSWGGRIKAKSGEQTDPKTGQAVFPETSDKYISQEDRQVTRELFALIARHGKVLRRLLNEYGCHWYIRPKITSMLDLASRHAQGKDLGGYWNCADEYAGTHLWGGECSVRDELANWAQQLRTEAAAIGDEYNATLRQSAAPEANTGAVGRVGMRGKRPCAEGASTRKQIRKGKKTLAKPLTDKAAAVLDLLKGLPPNRGMKGPEILDSLNNRNPPINFDQSTLTKRIIPELKAYGVKNRRGVGYYIDPSLRRNDATSTPS